MIAQSRISRRNFIKITSIAGGGLVLGAYILARAKEASPLVNGADSFTPNVWIAIDKSGTVTITVARSEMGQGVRTSLPMIVAEELEADWSRVRIEQAPADPAKYGSQGTSGSSSVIRSRSAERRVG